MKMMLDKIDVKSLMWKDQIWSFQMKILGLSELLFFIYVKMPLQKANFLFIQMSDPLTF